MENVVKSKEEFLEIMRKLDGEIKDAYIRVCDRKYAGLMDSDLINIRLSDAPLFFAYLYDNISIVDSGENKYTIEMDKFDFADITDMEKESTFGFLRTPCHAITIFLKTNQFIVFYYWLK